MNGEKPNDIRIQLKFLDPDVDARILVGVFDDLEAVLYQTERRSVEEIADRLGLDALVREAALERLRKYRGQRVRLKHVKEGSFLFEFVIVGVFIWILHNIVGETVKKGWMDSKLNRELSGIVRQITDRLGQDVIIAIRKANRRIAESESHLLLPPEVEGPTIVINIKMPKEERERLVPTISEILEDLEKRK